MEPATGLTVLGAAIGSAKLLEKLLGPTADYLGGEIKNYAEKGIQNLSRIFINASKKLGDKLNEPGQVPPKILKGILAEGYFCEDELSAEYFGGVLASSRSQITRDDRGTTFITLISRLSSYQIRAHYLFYTIFRNLCHNLSQDRAQRLGLLRERKKLPIYVPYDVYVPAMDFQLSEPINILTPHIMHGLAREVLIESMWSKGSPENIKETYNLIESTWITGSPENIKQAHNIEVNQEGILFYPSAAGMELYLWAHGYANIPITEFLKVQFSQIQLQGLSIPDGSICFTK